MYITGFLLQTNCIAP